MLTIWRYMITRGTKPWQIIRGTFVFDFWPSLFLWPTSSGFVWGFTALVGWCFRSRMTISCSEWSLELDVVWNGRSPLLVESSGLVIYPSSTRNSTSSTSVWGSKNLIRQVFGLLREVKADCETITVASLVYSGITAWNRPICSWSLFQMPWALRVIWTNFISSQLCADKTGLLCTDGRVDFINKRSHYGFFVVNITTSWRSGRQTSRLFLFVFGRQVFNFMESKTGIASVVLNQINSEEELNCFRPARDSAGTNTILNGCEPGIFQLSEVCWRRKICLPFRHIRLVRFGQKVYMGLKYLYWISPI